jgi:two-component system, OmpR family, phosphate regulon sensor histidine kinase PhoR
LQQEGVAMTNFATSAGAGTADLHCAGDFQAALLGMAGHDLRQPLQIIQGTYELLRTRACSLKEQAWLDRGERAIGSLREQLDRLLGAACLYEYTKKLEMSSVALAPLFWRLCNENEDAALRRGIYMRACATKAHVLSNAVLLSGILRNLVTNAVKYTEPGGRILVGCRRSGAEVRIDVYDTGIGIAPEQLVRIFDAFERLDSARCDGLGIGLFVVRRALDVLGHRIEVSSTVSKGSRFSIIAPASNNAARVIDTM